MNHMTRSFSYSGKEELENARYLPNYNRYIASLFSRYITADDHVIDFGAGIGTISTLVNHYKKFDLTCVEIDADQINILESKGFKTISSILNYKGQADVVYSSNVLEHIKDDLTVLTEIREKLKIGGHVVFWVPAFEILWTPMDDRVEHYRRYTKKTISLVFTEAGFDVEDVYYQDSIGFFLSLIFKWIGNKDGRVNPIILKFFDTILFPISRFFDIFFKSFFGKNVVIVATNPSVTKEK